MENARRNSLIEAYLAANYFADWLGQSLRIGQRHPGLDELLLKHHSSSWAFLTAFNPMSRQLEESENIARNQTLLADLQPYVVIPGRGEDPSGIWPAEPSFLVLGIDLESAEKLAIRYGQMAFLFGERGMPVLMYVRGLNQAFVAWN